MKRNLDLLRRQFMAAFRGDRTGLFWLIKFAAVILVFLLAFYPAQKNLNAVSSNAKSMKAQIEGLKNISTNLLTEQEVVDTQHRLKVFGTRIAETSQAAALLDMISSTADENHLNVVQIYSDSPQAAKDDKGRELEFGGTKLFWIGVNFRVETDFKSLGNFLYALNDRSQWEYVVESMHLQKTPQGDSLQCDLTLNFIAR